MSAAPNSPFADFPPEFRGARLRPGDAEYSKARAIYNMRAAASQPALIAQALDVEDVVCVMRYAAARAIPLAVRGGGHSVDGYAMPNGQLVLDLSLLRSLSVDAETRIVRAGAGVLLGELDAACQEYGLVVPAGTVSTTGIAGLTLGGGVGYNMRRYGATVDSLLSCQVVTTDGRVVTASVDENPDLFWALRGGGGNFGVVTEFTFRAYPFGPLVGAGVVLYALEDAAEILPRLETYMAFAPRELSMIAALVPTPPFPGVPEIYYGKIMLSLLTVYTGELSGLGEIVGGLAALGTPAAVAVGPAPWVIVNRMLDEAAPYGRRVHTRGGYLAKLNDDIVRILVDWAARAPEPATPGPGSVQNIWFMGGAISEDFAEDSVAFSREGAGIFWECVGQWDHAEQDAAFTEWVDGAGDALLPEMLANGYVNLTSDRGPAWLRGLYGKPEKYERLLAAKAKWDPQNLLRFNKNFRVR